MESERSEAVLTAGQISSDVSNNHLAAESGSLGRSSQGSISTETVVSEKEHFKSADLREARNEDEKGIVDKTEEDKLHEEMKSVTNLGSKASHKLPEKEGETNESNKPVNKKDSNTKAKKKRNKKLKRTTEKRTAFDGRKVVYVTECTQTDWNWKDKAEKSGKGTVPSSSAAPSPTEAKSDSRQSLEQTQGEMENRQEIITVTDLTPFFLVPDDEFGIPVVELSSDSDASSEEPYERPKYYRHHLPSVGPPQILRYIRESEILEKTEGKANDNWDHLQREPSYETPAFEEHGSSLGMFSGPCEFCGVDIKPFPSLDQQLSQSPDSLYCCEEYREFVEFATTTAVRMEEEKIKNQQQISIKVHAHYGSAHDRHLAKEKAVQRMHERELLRREQEANGLHAAFQQTHVIGGKGPRRSGPEPGQGGQEPRRDGQEPRRDGQEPRRDGQEARRDGQEPRRDAHEPRRGENELGRVGFKPGRGRQEPGRDELKPGGYEYELRRKRMRQNRETRGHLKAVEYCLSVHFHLFSQECIYTILTFCCSFVHSLTTAKN
ncbi:unnamed protein product, partial [Candidula unifasciata]